MAFFKYKLTYLESSILLLLQIWHKLKLPRPGIHLCSSNLANRMSSSEFCLKWNNYQGNIINAFGNLKLDEVSQLLFNKDIFSVHFIEHQRILWMSLWLVKGEVSKVTKLSFLHAVLTSRTSSWLVVSNADYRSIIIFRRPPASTPWYSSET